MFLCPKCHEGESCTRLHFTRSHGRCEGCEKVDDCVDCHAYRKREKQKKPPMDKNGNPVKRKVTY